FQAEDGIRDFHVTGVQTCALPILTIAGVQTPEKDDREDFSISEMCAEFGVTARALRFYEDEGLISPRRHGLSRIYSHRDRARLEIGRASCRERALSPVGDCARQQT